MYPYSCCYGRSDSEASTEIQYSMLQNFYLLSAGKPCKGSNNHKISITFSNVLDSLCAKEHTCITTDTKDRSFVVVKWLVRDSPCGGRGKEHFDKSKKVRYRVALTSTTFTPPTRVQEPTKEAPKVHLKIFRWLLELVRIQPPIVQICKTEVGRTVVFWYSTRGKVRR